MEELFAKKGKQKDNDQLNNIVGLSSFFTKIICTNQKYSLPKSSHVQLPTHQDKSINIPQEAFFL